MRNTIPDGKFLWSAVLLAVATGLHANEPILPLAFGMGLTFVFAVYTAGGALLAVSVIEAVVLRKILGWTWKESLKLSLFANLLSTAVGLAVMVFSSFGVLYLAGCLLGGPFLMMLISRLHNSGGGFGGLMRHPWLGMIGMTIVLVALGILAGIIQYAPLNSLRALLLWAAVSLLLLAAGFGLSILTEAWLLYRCRPDGGAPLRRVAVRMNCVSYGVLLILVPAVILLAGKNPVEIFIPAPRFAQKRTMADMKSLGNAIESYEADYGHFPAAADLDELCKALVPDYIANCIRQDGWSTYLKPRELSYRAWEGAPAGCKEPSAASSPSTPALESSAEPCGPRHYLIASPGQDGIFEPQDARTAAPRETGSFNNDIILRDGKFIESPSGKQTNAPVQ